MSFKTINNSNEVQINEDAEADAKYNEIIDLLVAAGYFRARIEGLTAFDKVVGGMIWTMDCCNIDVNIDLLFQENSTIGQKIALSEKIVSVLPKMECLLAIEPHQIQGLDFVEIFRVIQWLVKKSVKIREERREFIRNHAIFKFQKQFGSSDQSILGPALNIKKIQEQYRRKRIFKRKSDLPKPKSEQAEIESTLFEYGGLSSTSDDNLNKFEFSQAQEFMDGFSLKTMGTLVNSQINKIAQVSQHFDKLRGEIKSTGSAFMKKQRHMVIERKNLLMEEKNTLIQEIEEKKLECIKIKNRINTFEDSNKTKSDQFGLYEKLENLILLESSLKLQEQSFKEYCRKELEELQNLLREASLKNQSPQGILVDKKCEVEKENVQSLKLQIAKKNRSIAFLKRQLDEIPGRGELAQYQRRFLELYNEVAQKHEETKQFYIMYNALDDTKLYLSKELSLLNSVLDNYSDAMSNSMDKEEYMRQFESIVSAIKQNKLKVEKRREEERYRQEELGKQLLGLLELQWNYFDVFKELRFECKRNEELLARLRR